MTIGLTKTYTPSSGDVANATSYNTDISALFNAFSGIEAQTSTLGGLKITPSANGTSVFNVTNAAGTSIFAVDTTNSKLVVVAQTRYLAVPPAAFVPVAGTVTAFEINNGRVISANTTEVSFVASVNLPHGAIVTLFRAWWFRNDSSAAGTCALQHNASNSNTATEMGAANSNASSGYHSVDDTSISDATIDNSGYSYGVAITLTPNDSQGDVYFMGALIQYTITTPLP